MGSTVMPGMNVVAATIKAAVESHVWPVNIDIRPGHDRAARTPQQGGQGQHGQADFDPRKRSGYFVHAEFPFMDEAKVRGGRFNLTNRSLMAHRNMGAARPEPQT
jgi:hypothetical protein